MPSYQLKRTYQAGYMPSSKRRKVSKPTLTRALALRKPEVKDVVLTRTIDSLDASAGGTVNRVGIFAPILQGVKNSNRIGDKIRVLSIQVTGRATGINENTSFQLICPNNATRVPQISDFAQGLGNLYDLSNGWVLTNFVRDAAGKTIINYTHTFPLGMIVHYDQPSESFPDGQVSKNEVYATNINTTTSDITGINYSIRVRFVDV